MLKVMASSRRSPRHAQPESALSLSGEPSSNSPTDAAAGVFDEIAEDLSIDAADLSVRSIPILPYRTSSLPDNRRILALHRRKADGRRGCFRRNGANMGQAPETCQSLTPRA
jgi:hypothetical protein